MEQKGTLIPGVPIAEEEGGSGFPLSPMIGEALLCPQEGLINHLVVQLQHGVRGPTAPVRVPPKGVQDWECGVSAHETAL